MGDLIVSDTSCLIVLSKIQQLDLLKSLFSTVIVTPEVVAEFGEPLPEWIIVQSAKDSHLQRMLETQLDVGEASAISLALEIPTRKILIDERKGRRVASEMRLSVIGTARVLILAKERALIPSLADSLQALVLFGFRLSEDLIADILRKYEPPLN
jgi:predicted nucleic acid-binding protein